jgi:hypothetical protein
MPSAVRKAVKRSPLWPLLRLRRVHVYTVGAPKTGTHSVDQLFSKNYRSGHERYSAETIRMLKQRKKGALSHSELVGKIRDRDRRRRLESESAHFLAHFCDVLAEAFPEAKFILTVREPRSWLRSMIDQCVNRPRSAYLRDENVRHWATLRDLYFGARPTTHPPSEKVLAEHDLHAIEDYLSYWTLHNRTVLDAVPLERLLIVRTRDLSASLDRIATFVGVSSHVLSQERSHSYKAPEKHGLLDKIDEHCVREKIVEHCSGIMTRVEKSAATTVWGKAAP